MERTIDGIDFIAKSEVLRIIEREHDSARSIQAISGIDTLQEAAWRGYADAMETLKDCLTYSQER